MKHIGKTESKVDGDSDYMSPTVLQSPPESYSSHFLQLQTENTNANDAACRWFVGL